jgi:hypothetical protein
MGRAKRDPQGVVMSSKAPIAQLWLRKDRPWVYDVVRVLADRPAGLTLQRVYDHVRDMRHPIDLPKPKEFEATVRRTIYNHASQSKDWCGGEENDLFRSPKRGTWQVNLDRARAWIIKHEMKVHGRTLSMEELGL